MNKTTKTLLWVLIFSLCFSLMFVFGFTLGHADDIIDGAVDNIVDLNNSISDSFDEAEITFDDFGIVLKHIKREFELLNDTISNLVKENDEISSRGLEYTYYGGDRSYGVSGIGSCKDTNIIVPSTHNGIPVISIDASAFENCTDIRTVTLPSSIKFIEASAFMNCKNLITVDFEEGSELQVIGALAFSDCENLVSIDISDTTNAIRYHAFAYCDNLKNIYYSGKSRYWMWIAKEDQWNYGMPDYVVHCTDGDLKQ